MRAARVVLGVAVCAIAIVAATLFAGYLVPNARASTGPIPLNCNRACLEDLVNQYLAALAAHDPKRLPLSADVMYTENDQQMDVGDGFWKTAEGPGITNTSLPIPKPARWPSWAPCTRPVRRS